MIYVLRAFGGVLAIMVAAPTPPPVNCTMVARKGTITFLARKS